MNRRSFLAALAAGSAVPFVSTTPSEAAVTLGFLNVPNPTASPFANPAIFFSPHQDDETLTMGAQIAQHVNAGRYVILQLITDGHASNARNLMNPVLSYPDFVAARNREFLAAALKLGVHEVHFLNLPDGQLSSNTVPQNQRAVEANMASWMYHYPQGSFKTMSPFDSSPDHALLGQALGNAARTAGLPVLANGYRDLRYMAKQDDIAMVQQKLPQNGLPTATEYVDTSGRVVNALREYQYVNESIGRYGIGQISVGRSIEAALARPSSWTHL